MTLRNEAELVSKEDLQLVVLGMKVSLGKKFSKKNQVRTDVVSKTLFRLLRSFYNSKLESLLGKNRKAKSKASNVLLALDMLSQSISSSLH